MFSSTVGVCWMLFLKSQGIHRSQRPAPITSVNAEAAMIIWPYLYRITDIHVSLQKLRDRLQSYTPHNPKGTQGSKGWLQPMMYGMNERDLQDIKTGSVLYGFICLFSYCSNPPFYSALFWNIYVPSSHRYKLMVICCPLKTKKRNSLSKEW